MRQIIDAYRQIIVQIATPYSRGTGFYLPEYGLVVTNEHVVRDNSEVVVFASFIEMNLAPVVYLDELLDLAFLKLDPIELSVNIELGVDSVLNEGDPVMAMGHPFGLDFSTTQGIVSSLYFNRGNINYIQHDAALNPGNSGGPLIDKRGKIVGINTFIISHGENIGFSLPIQYVQQALQNFREMDCDECVKCSACEQLVCEVENSKSYCPHCGASIILPSKIEDYEAFGITATLENMLIKLGYDVRLARRGPNHWEVRKGSAYIKISYHEPTGLIIGDAVLCKLPKENVSNLYHFMLLENNRLEGLTLSVKEQEIILSLLMYDQYLNTSTATHLFQYLFQKADDLDNQLVEEYGAQWLNQRHQY